MHKLAGRFVLFVEAVGEGRAHGDAAFPRHADGAGGHALLGGDVVFIGAADGAVGAEQAGTDLPGFRHEFGQADVLAVLGAHLAAVQPQDFNGAQIPHQLHELIVRELNEFFPNLGMGLGVVGGIAVIGHGFFHAFRPVPGAVPVRLGKVRGDGNAPGAEGVEHRFGDVGVLVGVEGAVCVRHLVIGILGIVHAEAVVVLGGEDQVFEAVPRGHVRPFFGLEAHGIEALFQPFILGAEGFPVGFPVDAAPAPFGVAVGQGPGFADAQLGVNAEVHHQAQLLILKPFQLFLHQRVGGANVFVLPAASVHTVDDRVCHSQTPSHNVFLKEIRAFMAFPENSHHGFALAYCASMPPKSFAMRSTVSSTDRSLSSISEISLMMP